MRFIVLALCLLAAACTVPEETAPPPPAQFAPEPQVSTGRAMDNFVQVVATVAPVAERFCRQRAVDQNCDFQIVVDTRPELGANAYQTLDRQGRPVIGFTPALIAETRNRDELAFVLAHEAAHHIRGHIGRTQRNATVGALVFGELAGAMGISDAAVIQSAQQMGANVAARSYSKEFELEADALGTQITAAAGYDPLQGAAFFFRIPDPGDRFLGTHPANADRLRTVQRVAAGL
ncbi:M48 family metallopeptidase [Yoonia sp.]|uniref:M48 family metallopeptidase n=1 Tax=Yoonia sp. TaxID=2212373 RepID=UPI0019DEA337|nr:M48 family metallopeptidase [Yoonia sp.]MBE0413576.1 M48 family metallopeptidase [Yoonia sp.]